MTSADTRRQVARDAFLDPFALIKARLEGDRIGEVAVIRANGENAAGLIYGLANIAAGLITELADSIGMTPVQVITFMQAMSNEVVDSGLFDQLASEAFKDGGEADDDAAAQG